MPDQIFDPGNNCWVTSSANHVAPLIDCANFYRALHESISRAKHSIFIVGWDIDSRIDLLRGEEAEQSKIPVNISELLEYQCKKNPELEIYLLRWDPSLSFFTLREPWMEEAWEEKTDENVHIWLDDSVPTGGCQHQKVIVVDDEIAFTGGMDVTVRRWDTREHNVIEPEREDEGGKYGPFHDVHTVVSGPVVKDFAQLVRWRWNRVADVTAPEIRDVDHKSETPPEAWPQKFPPVFNCIPCAIARTIPEMDDTAEIKEVEQMLTALIEQAEDFIYIENQFATTLQFAELLNKQLKEKPNLHVLFLSSYKPESLMEQEVYWATRIDFRKTLQQGIASSRVRMVYSAAIDKNGNFAAKRVHAKVMTIDDKYLVIGSSNLSQRSMSLDTECDLILAAEKEEHKKQIREIRHDLIAEHSGNSMAEVEKKIQQKKPINRLLKPSRRHAYRMLEVEDEKFTKQTLQEILLPISDPNEPVLPTLTLLNGKKMIFTNPKRKTIMIGMLLLLIALLAAGFWAAHEFLPWLNPDKINEYLEHVRGTAWALPVTAGLYLFAGLVFFPVTVLSVAVAAVYGPVWGPIYGMVGVILSSAMMFSIGQIMGDRGLRKLAGHKVQTVDEKISDSGIVGVAAIRLIPIAPFSLVNLVAGISSLRIGTFLMGTFLGMLPPMIAKGLVGDSITQIIKNPSASTISYLAAGILIWALAIYGSQKAVKYFEKKKQSTNEEEQVATQPA